MIQLSDLLADDIDQFSEDVQYIISSSKEFRELEAGKTESYRKDGNVFKFKHQDFFMRLMVDFSTQLVIDDPGTGKTCLAASITEYLYEQSQRMWRNETPYDEKNSHFKKVIFLARSDVLKNEFKKQLITKCTDRFNLYNQNTSRIKGYTSRKNFNHWYEMDTYIKFAQNAANLSIEKIIEYYSDCVFIVDEAHNLIIDDNEKSYISKEEVAKRQIEVYKSLQRIFDNAQRTKIMLLTATPMINSTREIMQIMNLILKDNKFPPNYNIDEAGIDELEPYFRGQISYTRSLKSKAKTEEMVKPGDFPEIFTIETSEGKEVDIPCNLWMSKMSKFQEEGYNKTVKKGKGFGRIGSEQLQAAIFVFPDGYYGMGLTSQERAALIKYRKEMKQLTKNEVKGKQIHPVAVKIEQKRGANKYLIMADDDNRTYLGISGAFKEYFNQNFKNNYMKGVKELSCKIYEILNLVIPVQEIAFIYSDYKTSGVYCVAACFEMMGYTRFRDEDSIFEIVNGVERIKPSYPKAPRFALFIQGIHHAKRNTILKVLNSKENRHGEYIKVFMASRIGRDGISLSNVKQIHMLNPSWNEAGMYQAKARGLRATSHEYLLEELSEDEELIIRIYNHCAILDGKEGKKKSVDYDRYRLAKSKDYNIKRIMRIMKILSNGCQLTKKRNIRKGVDYSPECDYDKCIYECYGPIFNPETDHVNTVNYNLLYSSGKIEEIINMVIEKFRYYNSFIFEEICGMTNSDPKLVSLALEKIINQKISFPDRFGYTSYLREDKGCFYIERSFPHGNEIPSCSMSFYTQGVIGVQEINIDKIPNKQQEDNVVNIVEKAILKNIDGKDLTAKEKKYLEKYNVLIYNIGKPKGALEILEEREQSKALIAVPGVKSDKIKELDLKEEDYKNYMKEDYGKKDQYLHILSSTETRMTKYAENIGFEKAYSKMRILDLKEYAKNGSGWRNLSESEKIVYNKIITYINSTAYSGLEENFDFYGVRLPNKNFLIRDLRAKKAGSKLFKRDSGGTSCEGYNKKELFELMWQMKIDLSKYTDVKLDVLGKFTKKYLYDELIKKKTIVKDPNVEQHLEKPKINDEAFNKWSEERLLFYHNLFKAFGKIDKNERESIKFCNIIENEMKERKQILS